ncbi:E3 ubiquitin-protein ligase arih1-like isoform X4 [Sesamum indicum]|uniref:RBR-type E3 ubiquitin transferase n=1 Tax=Sesamum indicum TaxID=4182 RepID=A0A6I9SUG1_SESIN|nr:E3 ubiquitin-protein ligase arih1-like isoform X4 [Sesamum indicum]
MVLVGMPPLAALKWPAALEFSGGIAANLEGVIALYHQFLAFFRSDSGVSVISFILYSAGTFLAITAPAWIFLVKFSNKRKKINKPFIPAAAFEAEVNGESPEGLTLGPTDDGEELTTDDAEYAEEMQFHEALLASIFTCEIADNPSSSVQEPIMNTELMKFEIKPENSSQSFCEICLENKESWQMFTNDKCPHSFCYDCTTSHIVTKIQDKLKEISCPAINCKAALNFDACRLMIPEDTLVQWDELLCMSLIPESQKLYCPFRDCLALLVNDSGEVIRKIKCLICKRSFCAECAVPWHSEFTCKEFQKLYAKRGGKDDKIVKLLAKKKNWQKCPKCNVYVEKTEGCVHMTCRCRYEFCYRCGVKWSESHGNCRPKS